MTESHALHALLFLADWAVKATAVLALARLVMLAPRASAAMRHLVWTVAFGAVLLLPAVSPLVPARHLVTLSFPTASVEPAAGEGPARPEGNRPADNRIGAPLAAGLLGVWLAGAAGMTLQGALGMLAVAGLRRRSVGGLGRAIDVAALAGRVGLARRWELRSSVAPEPRGAMTWGLLRPVVLLPGRAAGWPPARLEAVLLHELAHVRRRDSATQLLALAVCASNWFNPLVWLCARAMRADAEQAADDAVLRSGVRASEYATHLIRVAAEAGRVRGPLAGHAVMAAGGSKLEARVEAIVDPARRREPVGPRHVAAAAAAASLALVLFASARAGLVRADESDRPSTPPVTAQSADMRPAELTPNPAPGPEASRPMPRPAGADVLDAAPRGRDSRPHDAPAAPESSAGANRISPDLAPAGPADPTTGAAGTSPDLAPAGLVRSNDGTREGRDAPSADLAPRSPRGDAPTTTTGADVRRDSPTPP